MRTSARTQGKSSSCEPLHKNHRRANSADKTWVISPADPRADQLAKSLKVSPLLAQLLINRGVTDPQSGSAFLRPKLTDLISPELLPGVRDAAKRIQLAVTQKQKITLYGDYDVDGITGVAILWQILTLLGANVDYYIPHRIDEGYGLNVEAVESIAKAGTQLLITVDCGITAHAAADLAKKLGVDLIITDHHQFADTLPQALVIVHPALDKSYPNPDSSGSLVAFKLGWAVADLFKTGPKLNPQMRDFMLNATSLAAMGAIADVMELRGENRTLTSFGLSLLSDTKLPGLQALIESAELTGKGLDSYHIGFRLAPTLNAAGRIGHARLAVELLTSTSLAHATQVAEYLKSQNGQRQRFERKIYNHACQIIAEKGLDNPERKTIVLADTSWHSGVVGIVASRIVDKFSRPAIMINSGSTPAQGSARSVPGFDILAGNLRLLRTPRYFRRTQNGRGSNSPAGKYPEVRRCPRKLCSTAFVRGATASASSISMRSRRCPSSVTKVFPKCKPSARSGRATLSRCLPQRAFAFVRSASQGRGNCRPPPVCRYRPHQLNPLHRL